MTSCAPGGELPDAMIDRRHATNDELLLASHDLGKGLRQTDLSVPTIHCGGCIQKIEKTLDALPGVEQARVNLSARRVTIRWRADGTPPPLIESLRRIGYEAHLYDADADSKDGTVAKLVRALAVAGFAASNIMLLSVSIWSGAESATRDLFHWISALIALPAGAYSGRIFFGSAWQSLRHVETNMDVPISIGVLLAFGLSLYETFNRGPHAYFDASITLLFFLLIGRTLDHMMRERARVAVKGLARLAARGALIVRPDGSQIYVPLSEIKAGMTILLTAGERVPVNGRVLKGQSDIDCSLVSGESIPQRACAGSLLQAGTLNLTGSLTIAATAAAKDSFLAEMIQMMEAAESGRSKYRRISDRASRLYAPVVHVTAVATFVGWVTATGDVHRALIVAVAVLIITCPCALGLAVPMVQVVAARRLFEKGIMIKDGAALERLADVDTVVFDKTGTLTLGEPRLVDGGAIDTDALELAAAIASHSRHPYSRALVVACHGSVRSPTSMASVSEYPGSGLEARIGTTVYRLGRSEWALKDGEAPQSGSEMATVAFSKDGQCLATFQFEDQLRSGARQAVAALAVDGFAVEILSGDREEPVRQLASALGVHHYSHVSPAEKATYVASMGTSGRKVLMVGDGLNDAPALVASHASMAPASAADVGRSAADLVFLRESLLSVPQALTVARNAKRLVRENLTIAVGYNAIAMPIAILGYVTPLIAAVAMSLSSLVVVANALRLVGDRPRKQHKNSSRASNLSSPNFALERGRK
ncbi:MAG: cation-translocating P-type ATPase [Pseudolabrys sp.]